MARRRVTTVDQSRIDCLPVQLVDTAAALRSGLFWWFVAVPNYSHIRGVPSTCMYVLQHVKERVRVRFGEGAFSVLFSCSSQRRWFLLFFGPFYQDLLVFPTAVSTFSISALGVPCSEMTQIDSWDCSDDFFAISLKTERRVGRTLTPASGNIDGQTAASMHLRGWSHYITITSPSLCLAVSG